MELLLNLIWLIGSLIALAMVIRRAYGAKRPALMILATVGVICLFFPIISITDDLSPDLEAIEESISIRRTITALYVHSHELPAVAFVFLSLLSLFSLFSLSFLTFVETHVQTFLTLFLTPQTTPRAPPRA
jgi:hypothetical protein